MKQRMTYKVLKHKKRPDLFGVILFEGEKSEIYHATKPELFPETATIESLEAYFTNTVFSKLIPLQLLDYDLVEVELTFK